MLIGAAAETTKRIERHENSVDLYLGPKCLPISKWDKYFAFSGEERKS